MLRAPRIDPLQHLPLRHVPTVLLLFAAACAKGGTTDTPQSEVKIAASHHMFGFKSQAGFGTFPVSNTLVLTDRGTLNMFDDSTYTITRPSGTSGSDGYALAKDGTLSIYVTGSGRDPSVVYRGGYTQTTNTYDYFFTDRVSTSASPSIGFYYGTRVVPGQAQLEGAWHVGSIHIIFGGTGAILSPDNVGRAAHGGVSITGGNAGTVGTISGAGLQGTSSVTFGGSIQNLLQNNVGDGTCNLTLSYQLPGQTADSRVCYAAAGPDIVLGLDADEADGEAGIVVMLRKFDAPASPVQPALMAGTFHVGGYTAFINPANPGSDVFVGTLQLTAQGGFTLDATDNLGHDFQYTGIFTASQDGSASVAISGTNETWFLAIDREYKTVMFVDDFQELRSNGQIELNFGFGTRVKPPV